MMGGLNPGWLGYTVRQSRQCFNSPRKVSSIPWADPSFPPIHHFHQASEFFPTTVEITYTNQLLPQTTFPRLYFTTCIDLSFFPELFLLLIQLLNYPADLPFSLSQHFHYVRRAVTSIDYLRNRDHDPILEPPLDFRTHHLYSSTM